MLLADSIELYQAVAGRLLNRYYGISLADIGLQDAAWVRELIGEEIRPFMAITSCVEEKGFARIDTVTRDGVPVEIPLMLRDEMIIRMALEVAPERVADAPRSRKPNLAVRACFGM